jgi:hypothetical protein
MDIVLSIVAVIAFCLIVVGVPLSILRSLDEIKAGQRRIESRLAEFDARP